jgi:fructose-1,6-bisphosphatase/inositol monophosphatase family enzyme
VEIDRWNADFVAEYKRLRNIANSANRAIAQRAEKLWVRIEDYADCDLWTELEDMCVHAVISGGVTAMSYYRQAKKTAVELDEKPNPSYTADLQATISILRTFDSRVKDYARALECELYYLGEETVYHDELLKGLSGSLEGDILDRDEFFHRSTNSIRVIIDAIDGTANFIRGLPFFCSSIAIFVEEHLRVSAIYDPLRHEVYSAALVGPESDPSRKGKARVWDIGSGLSRDLAIDPIEDHREFIGRSLAVHIPRSDKDQRERLLSAQDSGRALFEELSSAANSIYCLNTGLLALALVANRALDGFVNIYTNPWDVAAGEVLLRACRCRVTVLTEKSFAYADGEKIGVVATRSSAFHDELLQLIEDTDKRPVIPSHQDQDPQ